MVLATSIPESRCRKINLGYRDPASALAHMAGLNSREDPRVLAIGLAEAILDAAAPEDGDGIERAEQLLEQARGIGDKALVRKAMQNLLDAETAERSRRDELPGLVVQVLKIMASAQADLMPYVFSKMTPDDPDQGARMVVQIAAPGAVPGATQVRVGPPPMPTAENQGNQGLSESEPETSDGGWSDGMANPLSDKDNSR